MNVDKLNIIINPNSHLSNKILKAKCIMCQKKAYSCCAKTKPKIKNAHAAL